MTDPALALLVVLSAVFLTVVILRVGPVRRSRALTLVFLLNPGLVGVLGGCALLVRQSAPVAAAALRFLSVIGVGASLPLLAFCLLRLRRPNPTDNSPKVPAARDQDSGSNFS